MQNTIDKEYKWFVSNNKHYYIKSPLNYTGNKFRILSQMAPYIPSNINVMVDLFCGGGTVGINVNCKKRVFIDVDEKVIGMLSFLSNIDFDKFYKKLCSLVEIYGLSNSSLNGYSYYKNIVNDENLNNGLKEFNKNAYYDLREDYNSLSDKNSEKAYTLLYLLMLYAFNNDIRFSHDGKFNLPIGKTDLNTKNVEKLKTFVAHMKTIKTKFICASFRDSKTKKELDAADFIYMDPPYLITTAVYNEQGKWTTKDEEDFMELLEYLTKQNKKYMLSNVLSKSDCQNEVLNTFINKNSKKLKVIDIDYNYRSASYNKKNRDAKEREVIIIPKNL